MLDSHTRRQWLKLLAIGGLLPGSALSHEYYARCFKLIHPWTDPTTPGQTTVRIAFRIDEILEPDRLLGARADYADAAELRRSADDEEPPAPFIEIPMGNRLDFAPGRQHVLLKGLRMPLYRDRGYPLTLVFEKSGALTAMMSMASMD
jgi:copper(I)-binding protein